MIRTKSIHRLPIPELMITFYIFDDDPKSKVLS